MGKLLALLGGWQGYAAAAALSALLAAGATFYITSLGYRLTIAQMQRDHANDGIAAANTALSQFVADANSIHESAGMFSKVQLGLDLTFGKISRDFNNAIKAHPLPRDCAPDAIRLHALSDAIAAANTAVGLQPVTALPASP